MTTMVMAERNWRPLAACRWADPDLFFPVSSTGKALEQIAEAKAICAGCRVQRECLEFALSTHQFHGVWGGLSEQERSARDYLDIAESKRLHRVLDLGRVADQDRD